jgi:pimeloyl-ACP methyl ester carboxylesterase
MRRLVVPAVALATVAALAPAVPGQAAPATAGGGLVWGACPPPEPGNIRDPRMQCAALRVPMDYRNPGHEITITVSRITTGVPGQRRGVLLSNPGGPGGTGLDLPGYFALVLPAEVQARYDLIGFDPRGVGASTPISCGLPADVAPDLVLAYPAPDGSIAQNVAFARATARSCAERTGDLLRHLTTANTARDMDRIRAALGEQKISYLGYSYGTYLGAVYASLFPRRGDRIVLDSAVDPDRVWHDTWKLFGIGTALRLPDFTSWAANRDDVYQLGATPDAVRRTFFRIAEALDREPLVLPGLVLNGNVFREITRSNLYDDRLFPDLAATWQVLSEVDAASADALRALATRVRAATPVDNSIAMLYAIACNDVAWSRDVEGYAREVGVHRQLWPLTAGAPANVWPCVFWPHRPVEPPVKVTSAGPRNILILQNLRDPATPWVGGVGMRTALGRRAAFVTVDGGGHGIYAIRSGPCTDAIATAFLADGTLPERDRFCVGPSPEEINILSSVPARVPAGPLGVRF